MLLVKSVVKLCVETLNILDLPINLAFTPVKIINGIRRGVDLAGARWRWCILLFRPINIGCRIFGFDEWIEDL